VIGTHRRSINSFIEIRIQFVQNNVRLLPSLCIMSCLVLSCFVGREREEETETHRVSARDRERNIHTHIHTNRLTEPTDIRPERQEKDKRRQDKRKGKTKQHKTRQSQDKTRREMKS
jgi:hypothetical protein